MLVVDASALLEVLLRTPAAAAVEERILRAEEDLHAPHLIDLEIAQVLRRNTIAGRMSSTRGAEALEILAALRLTRHAHAPFLPRIWELRRNLTAYDAAYVVLAEVLDATLITRDAALASIPECSATIEIL